MSTASNLQFDQPQTATKETVEDLTPYQQEKIKLQKETNKRLKDIDTTLDWFFWIMILGIIGYAIFIFFSVIPYL